MNERQATPTEAQIAAALNQAHARPGVEATVLSQADRQAIHDKAAKMHREADRLEGKV